MPVVPVKQLGGLRLDPVDESTPPIIEYVNLPMGSYKAGTILGELTAAPGTFAPYDSDNVDGSETPSLILKYSVTINSNGHAAKSNVEDNWIIPLNVIAQAAYATGVFSKADLVGLDQFAIDTLGRSISGNRFMMRGIGKTEMFNPEVED